MAREESIAQHSGTCTLGLSADTPGDLDVAYSTQAGEYVKIGKLIYITGAITTTTWTHSNASGNLRITGLPFAVSSGVFPQGAASIQGLTKANYTQFTVVAVNGATYAVIAASAQGQSIANIQMSEAPSATQQTIRFTLMYLAAS